MNLTLNPLSLLFCVGIALGALYRTSRKWGAGFDRSLLAAALAGIGIFYGTMHFDVHGLQTSFFCICLFAGALALERFLSASPFALRLAKPLILLGDISYSIYMIHWLFVNRTLLELPVPAGMRIALILAATLALSYLSYHWIELRLAAFLRRRFSL